MGGRRTGAVGRVRSADDAAAARTSSRSGGRSSRRETRALLRDGDQPHDIFTAVFDELLLRPTVLVLDDLHWADQATIDLLRFVLRRVPKTQSFVVGTVRDEEIGPTSPMRSLLGDVARSPHAATVALAPLSLNAVAALVGERPVDAAWLYGVTGGNAFYVCEMLDHAGDALPTTVRDAILARTAELDVAAWDLLNLLTCAPGAIPDHLLAGLGVTLPALRTLDEANLIRRSARGVAFRHDLCRLAVSSVIPPGAESGLHRRLIDAHDAASDSDPAVITHHALGAGDKTRVVRGRLGGGPRGRAHGRAHPGCRVLRDRARALRRQHGPRQPGGITRTAGRRVLPDQSTGRRDRRLQGRDADPVRARRRHRLERRPSLVGRLRVVQRQPRKSRRSCNTSDYGARRG